MIFFVNLMIYLFIIIPFWIIICVGIRKNSSFLFSKINSLINFYLSKNKKLFSVFNKVNNIYCCLRFHFLSIYFRYEILIKILLYYFIYFTLCWFWIQFFSGSKSHIINHHHMMNYQVWTSYVQYFDLYQSDLLLKYLMNIVNNIYYVEKNIIWNQIYIDINIFNIFLGHHSDFSDETNTKLLMQTVIQNEDLKEAIYFLPSATQEEILSGDMYRLNNNIVIDKNYEFKVITKKKILSNNDLFRLKVLYRHVDEIDLGVYNQKNMKLDLDKVKDQVNDINNTHIHDLFDNTISENKYYDYYFRIFLKKKNINIEFLTIEQKNFWKLEFNKEIYLTQKFNGTNEEKIKKICEIIDVKYKNVEHIEKQNPIKIKILEIDTSNEKIKKCHFINKSGVIFNNHKWLNKSCFEAVHTFINKIK